MIISTGNYFSEIANIDFDKLSYPGKAQDANLLKDGHSYVLKATGGGKTWQAYKQSTTIKGIIDDYLETLNSAIKAEFAPKSEPVVKKKAKPVKKEHPKEPNKPERKSKNPTYEPVKNADGFSYELDPQEVDDLVKINWATAKSFKHPQHGTLKLAGYNYMGMPIYEDAEGWRYKASKVYEDDWEREGMLITPGDFGVPPRDPEKREMEVRLAFPPQKPGSRKSKTTRKTKSSAGKKKAAQAKKRTSRQSAQTKIVQELLPDLGIELGLIGRFINLHEKPKAYKSVLAVFAAVNRAIQKGHIRKSQRKTNQGVLPPTVYHKEIGYLQKRLLYVLENVYKGKDPEEVRISKFDAAEIAKMREIRKNFARFPSVGYAIRFAGMQGKSPEKEKVKALLEAIEKAKAVGKIRKNDPNASYLPKIIRSLKSYLSSKSSTVQLEAATLNGIAGVVSGCMCADTLNGFADIDTSSSRRSTQASRAANPQTQPVTEMSDSGTASDSPTDYIIPPPKGNPVSFTSDKMPPTTGNSYVFVGRWAGLLNNPSLGFSSIIYGQPKSGKSTMAADLGGYLARNFGTVLYASIEEGDRETLRTRFNRLGVNHPDMHVKNHLPSDLGPYDFVIVDSASRGLMEIDTLRNLIQQWPNTTFFFLFHVTNKGLPRGGTLYRHEVDVLIEVKDGMAYADGRFGPGEMKIRFE